jgi:hypothetical protein
MRRILPGRKITANLEQKLTGRNGKYQAERKQARAAICQSIIDIAGCEISDIRARKKVRKIMKIVLQYDFHISVGSFVDLASPDRFQQNVENLIFDQREDERA